MGTELEKLNGLIGKMDEWNLHETHITYDKHLLTDILKEMKVVIDILMARSRNPMPTLFK